MLAVTAPCPYCYLDVDLRQVDFRCLGRPAAGKAACTRSVDTTREKVFSDLREYYPAFRPPTHPRLTASRQAECVHCGGGTGVRLCPHCHSRLPEGFDGGSPLFGLVGARSSGKTVMLAVLLRELATNGPVARRFGHVITLHGGGEQESQATMLKQLLETMESPAGALPRQTTQRDDQRLSPVVFEWKSPRTGMARPVMGDYKSTVFSFFDTAGEDLAVEERAFNIAYLLATNGIILLLDPFSFPGNAGRTSDSALQKVETAPENVLAALTQVLRQNEHTRHNRRIKQPVAVVISKIDAFFDEVPPTAPLRQPSSTAPYFDEQESRNVHDHIASLVAHWGGDGLLQHLAANFENYRFFGLSALGAEPDYAAQKVDGRGISPHRVAEPLLWLMSMRGVLPRQG